MIEEKNTSLFVERRYLTLGVKLVATFAMTYYSLYFLILTVAGFFYQTVFDPAYFSDTVNEQTTSKNLYLFLLVWFIVGTIVVSLILLFRKKRYGKFIFMIFTVFLIIYQVKTSDQYTWISFVLEVFMALIIAPLKVVRTFTEKIIGNSGQPEAESEKPQK